MIKLIPLVLLFSSTVNANTLTFKGEVVKAMPNIEPEKIRVVQIQDADIIHHKDGKTITVNYH